MGLDIFGLDILQLDILGLDILGTPQTSGGVFACLFSIREVHIFNVYTMSLHQFFLLN